MKERPILFSGPMVRAILAGQKTQTRRVVRKQESIPRDWQDGGWAQEAKAAVIRQLCPYGQPGGRMWVRETHRAMVRGSESSQGWVPQMEFRADRKCYDLPPICISGWEKMKIDGKWRPSIFMPRWASRISLEITGISVERVQNITPAAVMAEGIHTGAFDGKPHYDNPTWCDNVLGEFAELWDSINANRKDKDGNILPYSWNDNPWVWVIRFRKQEASDE